MGGAERVVSRLSNFWEANGCDVTVITSLPRDTDFYSLNPGVRRIALSFRPEKTGFRKFISRISNLIELAGVVKALGPDVAISFMTDMNIRLIIIKHFIKCRSIVSERTNPARQRLNWRGRLARRILYPFADRIVFVSGGVASAYPWLPPNKVSVIYNPASDHDIEFLPLSSRPQEILTVGRLVAAKGYDLLIDAFASVADKIADWKLTIVGEGPLRPTLEAQISAHGLSERILLPGQSRHPAVFFNAAQIYALSSRHEGFPNSLVEAMCAGLAPISFQCPYGPAEIITHGVNGLLLAPEDIHALAQSILLLTQNCELREQYGSNATRLKERLSIQGVAKQWEELF